MKLTDVAPLDLTRLVGGTKCRVRTIGVELEGGWKKLPTGVKDLVHDGSVRVPVETDSMTGLPLPNSPKKIGELVSGIMPPSELEGWLKQSYPSHINETCGLHIHMMPGNKHGPRDSWYQRLVTPQYGSTIVSALTDWSKEKKYPLKHPIWNRLIGKSQYCTLDYFPKGQIRATSKSYNHDHPGNRYTWINYCHGLHGTVECRGLPMFETWEESLEALQLVIEVTSKFLRVASSREEVIIEAQPILDDRWEEEMRECV